MAGDLHRHNLQRATDFALTEGRLRIEDVDVVAVTVGPGLALSLQAGLEFVRTLAKRHK